MGQFKPMVKMMTTEPSVILKLKKGGHVAMPKGKGGDDYKAMPSTMPTRGTQVPEAAEAPKKPSMAARRMAMKPAGALATPMMKKGGKAKMAEGGETPAMHKAEMEKMSKVEKELKSHESKPASKAHAGLKTGGVVKGQAGYKTGGVAKAQGGYKKGGCAGYADGGKVDSGKAEKMAQGNKKPSAPVKINELSGTFKKGGKIVKKAAGGVLSGMGAMTDAERRALQAAESAITPAAMEEMKRIAEDAKQDMATEAGYARATGRSPMRPGAVTDYDRRMMQEEGRTVVPVRRKKGGKC